MSLSAPKTPVTPIPEQAQFETQIDNVAGTKVERVKQPDGSYATVRSALPLSAEDQALQDTYKSIAEGSLAYIDKLTNNYDRSQIPWLDQYIRDYEATQSSAIDKAGLARTTGEEKALARFGQADSTAAVQARGVRGSDITDQRIQLSRDLSGIEQDARNQELTKQGSLFSLATGALDKKNSIHLGSLASLVANGQTQQQNAQGYNNTVASVISANNTARANSSQLGLSNIVGLTSLATPFVGSLFGAATGALAKNGVTGGWASYGNNNVNWNSGRVA